MARMNMDRLRDGRLAIAGQAECDSKSGVTAATFDGTGIVVGIAGDRV